MKFITFKRLAIYLITFFVLLGLSLTLTSFWKQWDASLYGTLYIDADAYERNLSDQIVVVNIEKSDLDSKDASLKQFRDKIIAFLNTVNTHRGNNENPKAILLDISFSKDTVQLQALKEAVQQLTSKNEKVYAVYSLKDYFDKLPIFQSNDAGQARVLYDSVFTGGRLHSGFIAHDNLITYPSDIYLQTGFRDSVQIESIIKRVSLDRQGSKINPEFEQLVSPLGPIEAMQKQTYNFEIPEGNSMEGSFSPKLNIDDKFILLGDLKNDYQEDIETPRTYFMAWALNEKLVDQKMVKQPMNNLAIIIGQTLFFSFFTVLVFSLLFKYITPLKTKPKTLAVLAFVISLIFFVLYGMLIYTFDRIIPIGLTLLGMLIAVLLTWRFAYKFLVTGVAEGAEKYDVFISYSHGNSAWVKQNVYEPLKTFKKENGESLDIFFDEKSIGVGEAFTSKYMWGIVDSKVFIPVISEEYYGKNHCKNEMDLAYKRSVEKLLKILPIAFSYNCVPQIYTHINFLDITVNPKFMEAIKESLLK
ncbi:toll/interleukin-1 receptor domain-containing protein [Gelidibacter algens]|nr:toll/interleukin-1 receptor domain-containing protein [Gelidibacter algens]OBX25080.1 hypothetical protein A9996_11825 [Gelidibacter algens]